MKLRYHAHANGGALALDERGYAWFVPSPDVHARLQRRARRRVPRAFPAHGSHLICNQTPPILPPLGGFVGYRSGERLSCWVIFPRWLNTMFWDRD